ncbi:MAG TPA: methyltransferase regulatory domain-containing protein [Sphingomonas sp.]|uniref:methyltransferase regulatory domain-containing protein n=1 Tax=Sphingomonas sp. TaxID=28214 RepID=UPI002D0F93AC|nr:methyltransferase regulatory domain-containing protein [Sphingomonas sp.]HMI18946.1 methyltransferase regulatory domain-containing protein [Sphingomonas sp.]
MPTAPTSYDTVAYPSMIFHNSRPDALAVIARLHGLDAPPIERARMLLVGGGDGLDVIALAAAFPAAQFVNFDIASQPIARGRGWSDAAGIANVRHQLLDILDAAVQLDGPFDYIVSHGIYAWVPDRVRAAVMPMIDALLSPEGVAFVSYNAMPGGHSRLALRDMMMHHVRHLAEPQERLSAARALLRGFAEPREQDQPITAAMRLEAQAALAQSEGLFFHDIFNEFYAPQPLLAVVADAEAHGLRYLGDARGGGQDKGFVDPARADISEAALLDRLQAMDYANGRYFRSSLFVRAEAQFSRTVDPDAARGMWVSTRATHDGDDMFRLGQRTLRVTDRGRAGMLRRLIAQKPYSVPAAELAAEPDLLAGLCHYALEGIIELSTVPPRFTLAPSDRPVASPLARLQARERQTRLCTLSHQWTDIPSDTLIGLIGLLDGTRDRATLQRHWAGLPASDMSFDEALQRLASEALLVA